MGSVATAPAIALAFKNPRRVASVEECVCVAVGFELIGAETPIEGDCVIRVASVGKKECFTKGLFGEVPNTGEDKSGSFGPT